MAAQRFRPKLLRTPVTKERKRELNLFEKRIRVRFRSIELLNLAFSHRSFANEAADPIDNNEKLEFLGDAVLGIVISDVLFRRLQGKTEGEMAKVKSFVVSETSLAEVARQLNVDNYLLIGKGEEGSGGRTRRAILADAMEAIIGAYYLDSGFQATDRLVRRLFVPSVDSVLENKHRQDYKTLLQEYVQKKYKTYPRYGLVKKSGPDHDRTFWIRVVVGEVERGTGKGKNKKEAEQKAAAEAYRSLIAEEKAADPAQSGATG